MLQADASVCDLLAVEVCNSSDNLLKAIVNFRLVHSLTRTTSQDLLDVLASSKFHHQVDPCLAVQHVGATSDVWMPDDVIQEAEFSVDALQFSRFLYLRFLEHLDGH